MLVERDEFKDLLKKVSELEGKVADYEQKEKALAEEKEKNVFLDEYVANVPDHVADKIKSNTLDTTHYIDIQYWREVKAINEFWKDLKSDNENYKKNQNYVGQLLGKNALEMRYEVYKILGKV